MSNLPIFRPSFGNRPDQLVGRDETLQVILDGLKSYPGSAERATLLIGQRGMGKTAMLLEIAERAQELDYVVARTTCGDAMLENLIEVLQRAGSQFVKEGKKPIKGFTAGALGFSVGLTFTDDVQRSFGFRVKLEMICERLAQADKRVLLLVDEVDPSIEQMRNLTTTYQELAGDEVDIAVIMAGLPSAVSSILNYKTLTFLNRAQRIALETVSISEVEAYYHSAFARAGITVDDPTLASASALTEGFPYLIQLIGYYLVKYADGSKAVSASSLDRAYKAAMNDLDVKVFQAMLNPLSKGDRAFLQAMAQDDGFTQTSSIEKRLGLSHGTVQTYRKRLIEAGVIAAPRRGEVTFVLPALADYLRRSTED